MTTCRSEAALRISAELKASAVAETACTGRLIVPSALDDAFTHADEIRVERGRATRVLQRSLVSWLSTRGPIDDPRAPKTTWTPPRSRRGQQSSRILFKWKLTRMPRDRRVRLFGVGGPSQRLLSGPFIPWRYGDVRRC